MLATKSIASEVSRFKDLSPEKLRGGYYTPPQITRFLARWAIKKGRNFSILEPSCGDGQFIEEVAKLSPNSEITGIELFESEASRARRKGNEKTKIFSADFFSWFKDKNPEGKYDVVIGNPPFIRYQSFPEAHREVAFELMKEEGLRPSRLTNAWVPFLAVATRALRNGGKFAFVVPAELLQVSYAGELRSYLSQKYINLTIITFRKLVFPGIQQEIILLLGEKGITNSAKISFVEVNDLNDLSNSELQHNQYVELDHGREKWTQYYLSPSELKLIRQLEKSDNITRLGNLAQVDVGVVTGNNGFFVLSGAELKRYKGHPYAIPIIGRSSQLSGIRLTESDLKKLASNDERVYLLQLGNRNREDLSNAMLTYIEQGESVGFHETYKCKIRMPNWWNIPSVWRPDAFLFRQIHDGPRIVSNITSATSTDTIHRLKITAKIHADVFAAVAANSLTYAFAEIKGRSYGGGVLELEPSEAESLPFPNWFKRISVQEVDSLMRKRLTEKALDLVDKTVLGNIGILPQDQNKLRQIWMKMYSRRVNRK